MFCSSTIRKYQSYGNILVIIFKTEIKDQSPQCIHHAWVLAKSPSPFFFPMKKEVPGKKMLES